MNRKPQLACVVCYGWLAQCWIPKEKSHYLLTNQRIQGGGHNTSPIPNLEMAGLKPPFLSKLISRFGERR